MNRSLLTFGILLIAAGIAWPYVVKAFYAVWRMPGNMAIHKGGFHFYFPFTLCLILSVIISVILMLIKK